MDEDSSTEQKMWQVYSFGKGNVFRLHLNESREAVVGGYSTLKVQNWGSMTPCPVGT